MSWFKYPVTETIRLQLYLMYQILFFRSLLSKNYAINNNHYLSNTNHVLGPLLRLTTKFLRPWLGLSSDSQAL